MTILMPYERLIETHPRIGLAAFVNNWEDDHTGDYPGRKLRRCDRHEHTTTRCDHCGSLEHRHVLYGQLLEGANKGEYVQDYIRSCGCRRHYSNHRRPW